MLRYDPGDSLGHRLDPRTKLAVQVGFATAAFAHATPAALLAFAALAWLALAACEVSLPDALWEFRAALPFVLAAPLLGAVTLGPPWIDPAAAVGPTLAAARTLLLLALATAYVHTTPAREAGAAVAWALPGRIGRFAGLGVGLVFRLLPALQADLARSRAAVRARLGTERPVRDRIRLVAVGGLGRALARTDRLSVALRARCLSWNPTPPPLRFGRADYPALVLAFGLFLWGIVPTLWAAWTAFT